MLVEAGSHQDVYQPVPMFGHQGQEQEPGVVGVGDTMRPLVPMERSGDVMTYSQYVNGSIFSIPKQWSQKSTDDLLVTVYSFIKTYLGASGAGQGSIDHRIEQAMDLVKSHLMTAVRSEVEELREKISKLEDTVGHLSRENEVLRANVQPEVLASLLGSRSILGSLPPEPGLAPHPHPALQPPSQH